MKNPRHPTLRMAASSFRRKRRSALVLRWVSVSQMKERNERWGFACVGLCESSIIEFTTIVESPSGLVGGDGALFVSAIVQWGLGWLDYTTFFMLIDIYPKNLGRAAI